MNKMIAAAALLLLTGMTFTAEERLRVDPSATLTFKAHAGTTYHISASTRSSYYAPQPRVVVPALAVVDSNGTRLATSGVVMKTDDPKYALQTDFVFTAPADGTYTLVVAAARAGEVIGSFREESTQVNLGGSHSVVSSSTSAYRVPVIAAPAGIVTVKIVEAPVYEVF